MPPKDSDSISNEKHELEYVAKKFDITVEQVKEAKAAAGTNKREAVYEQIAKLFK